MMEWTLRHYRWKFMQKKIYIIGAGPAGLTAAFYLAEKGHEVDVFESDAIVGGLSKTVEHQGYRIDIGGHRFFSPSKEVNLFWKNILSENFLVRRRKSRILYKKKLFQYPLSVSEILFKFNPVTSLSFILSYFKVKLSPDRSKDSFKKWVVNNFGNKLFEAFFKSYTEKVWGRSCEEISSDWAAQRISELNMKTLFLDVFKKLTFSTKEKPKTLIEEFFYPRLGPGMMWEACTERVQALGGRVHLNTRVIGLEFSDNKWSVELSDGTKFSDGDDVISSAPITNLFKFLNPKPKFSFELTDFKYRDFLTIALMFEAKDSLPDNWIYVHEESVKVARIQNYKRWSPEMVPHDGCVCYGLEYFCQEGDDLWNLKDEELFDLAKKEVRSLGIDLPAKIVDYKIIRVPKAYPVYDHDYRSRVSELKEVLKNYPGLHLVGRNGMHRYNNQDHSIKTAMLVSQNILNENKFYDPWLVNQKAEYIERGDFFQ